MYYDLWSLDNFYSKEKEPIIKPKSYGKGHFRHNRQQKERANNLKVAKRRKQRKANRKAKRRQL